MNDVQLKEYLTIRHNHITNEELHKDILETSPQITGVYYEHMYDLVTIVTPDNQFTFFI